ncbi:hypothetical protein BGX21_003814 [Mortierella sp. AD011]|nr:hypothetical protein BGX20_004972 [Mortierella sp. AD010]KAF9375328.1 hypothetical protein BGX21_003814 [Mortierella sp. AD011]
MKLDKTIPLIPIAVATVVPADPLEPANVGAAVVANPLSRRDDNPTLRAIVKLTTGHYSDIANLRLGGLLGDMKAVKVTSGSEDLPKERALLNIAVKAGIERLLTATIEAETDSNDNSADEKNKRKLLGLDAKLVKLIQNRIQVNNNVELLSKECIEKMTKIEIAPAEESLNAESVESEPATVALAPVHEEALVPEPEVIEPAYSEVPTHVLEVPAPEAQTLEPKVAPEGCIMGRVSGCKGAKDAKIVISLHADLEKKIKSRLGKFYEQEVLTECEKCTSLVGDVLDLLNLSVKADVDARTIIKADTNADTWTT